MPNPNNASDAYPVYDRGHAVNAFIRNGEESEYSGILWPGFSVFPDFLMPSTHAWWTSEIQRYYEVFEFDGFWLDVNDANSFCTGSCGQDKLDMNPIHIPLPFPGDPDTAVAVDYRYPEMFAVSNASEAASAR